MLFRITVLMLVFTSGWFLNDRYQTGQTLDFLGRNLNFSDLSQTLWLMSAGLIVANIAKEGEPFLKRFKILSKLNFPFGAKKQVRQQHTSR